ncbi:LysE family translocator [Oryzibacter oryziterrae]|uniref:LysE family translocator n=1 Tax=Oryzibacter oryziterrae TaxID=2766474 RepID=UPI001F231705|nr:LysE family translocator [Oryzibacter oryziterrae]
MTLISLLLFAGAFTLAAATPGPGIGAIVGRALGGGFWAAVPMIAGIVMGDFCYLSLAIFGLAAIAQKFALIFVVIRYAGAAYLLFLAWKLWTSRPDPAEVAAKAAESPVRTVLAGLALTLGNPKAIVFYLALLPTIVPLESITVTGYLELVATMVVLLSAIGCAYAAAAAGAREFFKSPRAMQRLNRSAGVVMAGAAVAVVTR